jgi:single-strand DNA-binding protein
MVYSTTLLFNLNIKFNMKSNNKVSLRGHLGKDPLIKTYDSGTKRATLFLATKEIYRNSLGKAIESTQWHRLIAWGRTAEQVERMLHKGTQIALEGRLHQYKVDKGTNGMRTYHEILLDRFELLVDQVINTPALPA